MTADKANGDDDFTSRPAAKRVRSDRDHSKADTKEREAKRHETGDDKDGKGGKEQKEGHEDHDWLAAAPFQVGASWEGWETKWRQSCWCGKTAFVFSENPLQVKFCHCEDCQRLHGAPMQMAAIFKKDVIRLDGSPEWLGFLSAHGEVHPLSNTPTPLPRKTSCRACGSPLFDEGRNMCMAFPPTFEFARNKKEKEKFDESKEGEAVPHGEGKAGGQRVGLPDAFKPSCHIFYERRVMDIKDGLVKWRRHKDSEEMGEEERP